MHYVCVHIRLTTQFYALAGPVKYSGSEMAAIVSCRARAATGGLKGAVDGAVCGLLPQHWIGLPIEEVLGRKEHSV